MLRGEIMGDDAMPIVSSETDIIPSVSGTLRRLGIDVSHIDPTSLPSTEGNEKSMTPEEGHIFEMMRTLMDSVGISVSMPKVHTEKGISLEQMKEMRVGLNPPQTLPEE